MEKQPICQTNTPHLSAHALCLYQKSGTSLIRLPHTSAASRPILMHDTTFMRPAHSGNKRKDWCDPERALFLFSRCSSLGVRALEIFLKSSRERSSNEMEIEPLRHHTKDFRLSRRLFPRSVRIAANGQFGWERSRAPRQPRLNIAVRVAAQQRKCLGPWFFGLVASPTNLRE
jgi:hypothetical protein